MKEKLRQFMAGRYGNDQLGRYLMGGAIVIYILFMLTRWNPLQILFFALLILYYYRAMSRNISRRYDENLRFLTFRNRTLGRFHLNKDQIAQRKYYRFYTCPSCKQKVRVPRGRGKIAITCPKCRSEFIRKS